jgi:hypothetical protein
MPRRQKMMRKTTIGLLMLAAATVAVPARPADAHVSVAIGLPGFGIFVGGPPVVYGPPVAYAPPPVVYAPPPVVYAPPPVAYGPTYYPRPAYYGYGYGYGYRPGWHRGWYHR